MTNLNTDAEYGYNPDHVETTVETKRNEASHLVIVMAVWNGLVDVKYRIHLRTDEQDLPKRLLSSNAIKESFRRNPC